MAVVIFLQYLTSLVVLISQSPAYVPPQDNLPVFFVLLVVLIAVLAFAAIIFGSIALAVPPGYFPCGFAAASQYLALVLQFHYSE